MSEEAGAGIPHPESASWRTAGSVYDFKAVDIDGHLISLDKYRSDHTLKLHATRSRIAFCKII